MLCKVKRAFGGPGDMPLEVGTIIDVSGWPRQNRVNLIDRHYMEPIGTEDLPDDQASLMHASQEADALTEQVAELEAQVIALTQRAEAAEHHLAQLQDAMAHQPLRRKPGRKPGWKPKPKEE